MAGKALRDRKRLSVESGEEDGGVPMSLHLLAEWADPTTETHLIVYFGACSLSLPPSSLFPILIMMDDGTESVS